MIINNNLQAIAGAYQLNAKNPAKRAQAKNAPSFKDEVHLSSNAQNMSSAVKNLKNMSDVRADKVEFFTNAIESGNYNVPAANIASKMLSIRF